MARMTDYKNDPIRIRLINLISNESESSFVREFCRNKGRNFSCGSDKYKFMWDDIGVLLSKLLKKKP